MHLKTPNFQKLGVNCITEIHNAHNTDDEMVVLRARISTSILNNLHEPAEDIIYELLLQNFKYAS